MRTKLLTLTPASAALLLERANHDNRPLRPGHVQHLADAMRRGEWRKTHQGLAFDKDGNLLDGQHRLHAIVKQDTGFKLTMLATYDVEPEAFEFIDATQLKRSVADSLRISARLGPIAVFMHKLVAKQPGAVTAAMAKPYAEYAKPEFTRLTDACGSIAKYWSCAAVQTAAILSMKVVPEPSHYVCDMYRAMIYNKQREMSPLIESFHRSIVREGMKFTAFEFFARCVYAFDEANSKKVKLSLKNDALYLDWASTYISEDVPVKDA